MWRLIPIEPGEAGAEIKEISAKLYPGMMPNFLRLLAKSRASATAYVQAEMALAQGELTQVQREEIALLVAAINGSKYCAATHESRAQSAGMSVVEIDHSRNALADDAKTQAMLHFVQALVLQRGEVSNDDFSMMRKAGFSDSEIIEVVTNVVLNIFTNYFNLLAQTDADKPSVRRHERVSR